MAVSSHRFLFFSLATLLGLALGYIRKRRRTRHIAVIMKSRTPADKILEDHFRHLKNPTIAREICEMLQKILHTDLTNLWPSDRLGVELGLGETHKKELLELLYAIEERYDIVLPPAKKCMNMTFERLVELVDKGYGTPSFGS